MVRVLWERNAELPGGQHRKPGLMLWEGGELGAPGAPGGGLYSKVKDSSTLTLRAVSSWKWVAKSVVQPMLAIKCSEMAQAKPKPSYVEVPLPSSSIITRDRDVAPCIHPPHHSS